MKKTVYKGISKSYVSVTNAPKIVELPKSIKDKKYFKDDFGGAF